MAMSTQQKSYEWHTATVSGDEGSFHFASVDGERWYGVMELPDNPQREHVEQMADYASGKPPRQMIPMSIATRGLRMIARDRGQEIVFHEVVRL